MSNPSTQKTSELPAATAAAAEPKKSRTTRLVVFSLVAVATLAGLITLGSWSVYRLRHTVINNATVKGRVHRLGARIDGQIQSVEVQPGEHVTRGQVLIRLVDDHLQAAAREAQAELQSAEKSLHAEKLAIEHERARLTLDVERCAGLCKALTGTLASATSQQEKWNRENERVLALMKSGVASTSERDAAKAESDNAHALVETAEGNLAAADSNCRLARLQIEGLRVREAGLEVLVAGVELARQRVASRAADLAATIIRAPDDGWVADRLMEAGGSAKIGEAMISLWLGAPWVEAWVDETKLANIKIGSAVDVRFTAFTDHKLAGRVEAIGVLTDKELQASPVPTTLRSLFADHAMVPVRIAIPGDEVRLQPGLTALVGIRDAARPESHQSAVKAENFLAAIPVLQRESQ